MGRNLPQANGPLTAKRRRRLLQEKSRLSPRAQSGGQQGERADIQTAGLRDCFEDYARQTVEWRACAMSANSR